MITYKEVKNNGWLLLEAVVGSKAYGLDTATSDTDIRGVFILPKDSFYGLDYIPQVANETNDIVYYELRRFVELLAKNNPNILELLNLPVQCIIYRHPLMDQVKPELFLSKLCEQSYANYAYTQIKKAYGLEKKIMQPMEEQRKSVLDFCFVNIEKEAVPLRQFLADRDYQQEEMGLTAIAHMRDCYNLFHSANCRYTGIIKKAAANEVSLSSIPKEEKPLGILYFNRDGYSVYCKQYKEYQEWVSKRNETRYAGTLSHGKKYDAKNMMHVFRLLHMAEEIAREGKVNVWRKDRDWLLSVKEGKYEYDELVTKAEQIKAALPELFQASALPDEPDLSLINKLLKNIRESYYIDLAGKNVEDC